MHTRSVRRLGIALLVLSFTALASGQQPGTKKVGGASASRIQKRTYDFKEAKKEMEYALFVPSKYDDKKKTPLLVALHGLGGNPQQIIRSQGLTELAEK